MVQSYCFFELRNLFLSKFVKETFFLFFSVYICNVHLRKPLFIFLYAQYSHLIYVITLYEEGLFHTYIALHIF